MILDFRLQISDFGVISTIYRCENALFLQLSFNRIGNEEKSEIRNDIAVSFLF